MADKPRTALIIELDAEELAVRLLESAIGLVRPPGASNSEILAKVRRDDAFMADGFERGARVCMEYFRQQCEKMVRPS